MNETSGWSRNNTFTVRYFSGALKSSPIRYSETIKSNFLPSDTKSATELSVINKLNSKSYKRIDSMTINIYRTNF